MGLKLENISKRFNDKVIFTNLNITFNSCGLYLIEGRSGSGKSTLLNIIAGFDKEDSGTYYLNDKEIVANKRNDLSNYISYVMQENNVLNGFTVLENLLLVTNDKQKILEYLRYVGLESLIDTKANLLSGGEKLRLNIARELIKDTSVLLLDEPTSSLDLESAKKVMEILEKIAKEKLVIIASHDLELMKEYNIKTIQIAKEVNFNDIDNEMVLNKEINLSLPFKYLYKYLFINIKKTPLKAFISLFVNSLLTGILLFFLCVVFNDKITMYENYFKQANVSNLEISYDDGSSDLNLYNTLQETYEVYYSVPIIVNNKSTNIYLAVLNNSNIVLNNALLDYLGINIEVGDSLEINLDITKLETMDVEFSNLQVTSSAFTVGEITNIASRDDAYYFEYDINYLLLDKQVFLDTFIKPEHKTSFLNQLKLIINYDNSLLPYVFSNNLKLSNSSLDVVNSMIENITRDMRPILIALSIIFIVIAVINIFIMVNNILNTYVKDILLFKTIGFNNKEISKLYGFMLFIELILSLIIGIILGVVFFIANNSYVSHLNQTDFSIYSLNWQGFLITIFISLIISFLVLIIHFSKFNKANLSSMLKNN